MRSLDQSHNTTPAQLTDVGETPSIRRSIDDDLVDIFNMMTAKKISLRRLLTDAFNSDNELIRRPVGQLYVNKGPADIVKIWTSRFRSKGKHCEYDDFTLSATDIVIDSATNGLKELTRIKDLQLPANNISPATVQKFLLRLIENLGLLGACQSYMQSRRINNCYRHWQYVDESQPPEVKLPTNDDGALFTHLGVSEARDKCDRREWSISGAHDGLFGPQIVNDACSQGSLLRNFENPWYLVYDNINIANRKYDQRNYNLDAFDSGTTAIIVLGEDIGLDRDTTTLPTIADFLP
ncbi:hypothetical protein BGZ54_009871, partial [Gamsiella multidivaricata]